MVDVAYYLAAFSAARSAAEQVSRSRSKPNRLVAKNVAVACQQPHGFIVCDRASQFALEGGTDGSFVVLKCRREIRQHALSAKSAPNHMI